MLLRLQCKVRFIVESLFYFFGICPACPPITRLNVTRAGTAICPKCQKRIHR